MSASPVVQSPSMPASSSHRAAVVMVPATAPRAMTISSQNPERVSVSLRNSALTRRISGRDGGWSATGREDANPARMELAWSESVCREIVVLGMERS